MEIKKECTPAPVEAYEAPVIEIVDVRVERGFQGSGDEDLDYSPSDRRSW